VGTVSKFGAWTLLCWLLVEVTEDRLDAAVEVDLWVAELLVDAVVATEAMLPLATSLGRVMTFL
jgi:hypothetical protein